MAKSSENYVSAVAKASGVSANVAKMKMKWRNVNMPAWRNYPAKTAAESLAKSWNEKLNRAAAMSLILEKPMPAKHHRELKLMARSASGGKQRKWKRSESWQLAAKLASWPAKNQ